MKDKIEEQERSRDYLDGFNHGKILGSQETLTEVEKKYTTICKYCGQFIKSAPYCWEKHQKVCKPQKATEDTGFVFIDWKELKQKLQEMKNHSFGDTHAILGQVKELGSTGEKSPVHNQGELK